MTRPSSTHGPAPEDDEGEDGATDDQPTDNPVDDQGDEAAAQEPTMDIESLMQVLDAQAGSLHCAIQTTQDVAEPGEDLPPERVESVRTEIHELQSAVEGLLTEHCPEATPWEHADEQVPDDHLDDFRTKR